MVLTTASSPVPLYHRVFAVLRQRIGDGEYGIGSQLPTEDELAAEFGVSRATVRQAVGELVRLRLVVRQQGRGTFVAEAATHPVGQRFRGSLADLISESKRAGIRDVAIVRGAPLPPRIASLLELPEPRGTMVQRIRTVDGEIFAYTVNYMADSIGAAFSESRLRSRSLMDSLEAEGIRLVSATQSIHAQLADLPISDRLGIDFGAAVLFVERLVRGARRRPVQLAQTWYRGDLYEYTVTLETRPGSGSRLDARFA